MSGLNQNQTNFLFELRRRLSQLDQVSSLQRYRIAAQVAAEFGFVYLPEYVFSGGIQGGVGVATLRADIPLTTNPIAEKSIFVTRSTGLRFSAGGPNSDFSIIVSESGVEIDTLTQITTNGAANFVANLLAPGSGSDLGVYLDDAGTLIIKGNSRVASDDPAVQAAIGAVNFVERRGVGVGPAFNAETFFSFPTANIYWAENVAPLIDALVAEFNSSLDRSADGLKINGSELTATLRAEFNTAFQKTTLGVEPFAVVDFVGLLPVPRQHQWHRFEVVI